MMETKNNKNAGNNINNIIPIKWIGFIIFILSTCLAQAYEQETYLNLQDVIEDLNSGGHSELAEMFASKGFHPDGIKLGVPCTPTEGKLYVSSLATGAVLEIDQNGTVRPYVNPKRGEAYGNSFDSLGNMFVSRIVRFKKAGGIDVVPVNSPIPADGKVCYAVPNATTSVNDLVVTKDGRTLFFADDTGGRIFRCNVEIDDVNVSCDCRLWLKHAYTASMANLFGGVDGLILDESEQNLYFNNFLKGKIYKVAINPDGTPATPQVVTADPIYALADGMSRGGVDGTAIYTATFKLSGGSAITKTDMNTGQTNTIVEDTSYQFLSPGAALTVDTTGQYETLFISAMDLPGYLLNYRVAGSDGGQIVKVKLDTKPQSQTIGSTCNQSF
ncbi:SMP-30/gluconolactonase/LRE family protein [Ketobacter sp.]